MKPTVYIETSIVSYLTARISRDLVVAGRQQLTRTWWDAQRRHFELYISELVVEECREGDSVASRNRLDALRSFPVLQTVPEAVKLASRFVAHKCVPPSACVDALHIAVATVNNLSYLMTWNCAHIANATIRSHLVLEADLAGYRLPVICTPEELLGGHHGNL